MHFRPRRGPKVLQYFLTHFLVKNALTVHFLAKSTLIFSAKSRTRDFASARSWSFELAWQSSGASRRASLRKSDPLGHFCSKRAAKIRKRIFETWQLPGQFQRSRWNRVLERQITDLPRRLKTPDYRPSQPGWSRAVPERPERSVLAGYWTLSHTAKVFSTLLKLTTLWTVKRHRCVNSAPRACWLEARTRCLLLCTVLCTAKLATQSGLPAARAP